MAIHLEEKQERGGNPRKIRLIAEKIRLVEKEADPTFGPQERPKRRHHNDKKIQEEKNKDIRTTEEQKQEEADKRKEQFKNAGKILVTTGLLLATAAAGAALSTDTTHEKYFEENAFDPYAYKGTKSVDLDKWNLDNKAIKTLTEKINGTKGNKTSLGIVISGGIEDEAINAYHLEALARYVVFVRLVEENDGDLVKATKAYRELQENNGVVSDPNVMGLFTTCVVSSTGAVIAVEAQRGVPPSEIINQLTSFGEKGVVSPTATPHFNLVSLSALLSPNLSSSTKKSGIDTKIYLVTSDYDSNDGVVLPVGEDITDKSGYSQLTKILEACTTSGVTDGDINYGTGINAIYGGGNAALLVHKPSSDGVFASSKQTLILTCTRLGSSGGLTNSFEPDYLADRYVKSLNIRNETAADNLEDTVVSNVKKNQDALRNATYWDKYGVLAPTEGVSAFETNETEVNRIGLSTLEQDLSYFVGYLIEEGGASLDNNERATILIPAVDGSKSTDAIIVEKNQDGAVSAYIVKNVDPNDPKIVSIDSEDTGPTAKATEGSPHSTPNSTAKNATGTGKNITTIKIDLDTGHVVVIKNGTANNSTSYKTSKDSSWESWIQDAFNYAKKFLGLKLTLADFRAAGMDLAATKLANDPFRNPYVKRPSVGASYNKNIAMATSNYRR